ncbi:MAG: peptide chain release factor N(5)-glutamine methyltransferase [Betaproteobacteria bacterium]|nr:peptide chain release factor N(5)-glutamine methyltransferase [Betaproteobacteria bacterium]
MTLASWLRQAASQLQTDLSLDAAAARIEMRLLAAAALQRDTVWLIAHGDEDADLDRLTPLLLRRLAGEPVAYILGQREFYGRAFKVSPAVLIPRPETEHLVEAALQRMPADASVLDLCTGSGCVAITLKLERPDCTVTATDLSHDALASAQTNATALHAAVRFHHGDLFAPLAGQRFDVIVSNPPYIAATDAHLNQGDVRFEPRLALISGPEGLDLIHRLVSAAADHLNPDGWLLFEHGFDQGAVCHEQLSQAGFRHIKTLPDWAGLARVTLGQRPDQR